MVPTNLDSAPVDVAFSVALKDATQELHDAAERSPFIGRLLGGELPVDDYARFLAQLHDVYEVLEEAAAQLADDPVAGPFAEPALTRLPSLTADLELLGGAGWRQRFAPTAATDALVDHLRATCFHWPGGFVAHHYVRYLGDLSGGQIIRRILERVYGFADRYPSGPAHAGVRFFVFEHLDNGVQFKKRYRELLDHAPWDAAERERVVAEANTAFRLNTAVFDSLGG
ncbi:heme oxygenase (biliverdin-producing) [Desertimonas flava]|jgi:heme oxygenase|uniref:biliverdin-producing heme oxygenase n=1 Tax=Desertimonas flava TaxID=2064846 RepID=UPI000E34945F|nr:biliverdin-producing heme oxygenase [Desertimonas flava]